MQRRVAEQRHDLGRFSDLKRMRQFGCRGERGQHLAEFQPSMMVSGIRPPPGHDLIEDLECVMPLRNRYSPALDRGCGP